MKIEKVKNGFIVEVTPERVNPLNITATMWIDTERHIFTDILQMLNFINVHFGGKPGYSVVEKE